MWYFSTLSKLDTCRKEVIVMRRLTYKVHPERVTDYSYMFSSDTHILTLTITELTGTISPCRFNSNLYTLRCNKHIFKFPYYPDTNYDYLKNFVNFQLDQIFKGNICSYEYEDKEKNNFFYSYHRYRETRVPTTLQNAEAIMQKVLNTPKNNLFL